MREQCAAVVPGSEELRLDIAEERAKAKHLAMTGSGKPFEHHLKGF